MKKTPIDLTTFAGLDLDRQPLLAAQTLEGKFTASTATNITIDQITKEITRSKGSSAWTSAARATGEVVLGVIEYIYQSGQRAYIVRTSSGFYLLNSAFTSAASFTSMNSVVGLPGTVVAANEAGQIPSYAQIGKHLVIVDGSGAYYWDGANSNTLLSTRTMEPPKAQAFNGNRPLLTLASGGSFTANTLYSVRITFYSATAGHSPPLECGAIRTDSSNKKIHVATGYATSVGSTGDGYDGEGRGFAACPVGATDIYFWVQGHVANDKNYYFNASIGIDDLTDYTEIVLDLAAPLTVTAMPTFNGPPGGVSIVCEHVGRAFYTGSRGWPTRIWYSETGQPFTIKPSSWFDVGQFDDPIISLVSFPQGTQLLGILKKHSVWSLSGTNDLTFITGLQRVDSNSGCISPHGVYVKGSVAYFAGSGGFYRWPQGGTPEDISAPIRTRYLATVRGAA